MNNLNTSNNTSLITEDLSKPIESIDSILDETDKIANDSNNRLSHEELFAKLREELNTKS